MSEFAFAQIDVIPSPRKEKFAIPHQLGLLQDGRGELHLLSPYKTSWKPCVTWARLVICGCRLSFHQTMEGD